MDQQLCKAVLKCVLVEIGALFVMLNGELQKLWWLADNWDLLLLVCTLVINTIVILLCSDQLVLYSDLCRTQ